MFNVCYSAKLMAMCWQFRSTSRPSFGQVLEILNPDLSESFREESYYFNEVNQKPPTSDADDDTLTDDAKTPLTGTPHYVSTPMASSLQHHSDSTSSRLLPDELDYQDTNNMSSGSEGSSGRSMLDHSHSPVTYLDNNPHECVPLRSFGPPRTMTHGGSYWNTPVKLPHQVIRRPNSNSAIHSNGDSTEHHKSRSNTLGNAGSHPRNGLANGHIPMSYNPSGANRV